MRKPLAMAVAVTALSAAMAAPVAAAAPTWHAIGACADVSEIGQVYESFDVTGPKSEVQHVINSTRQVCLREGEAGDHLIIVTLEKVD
jgi:hypothetical protein